MFKKFLLVLTVLAVFPGSLHVYASQPREIRYSHALSRAINRNPSIQPLDREVRQLETEAEDLLELYRQLFSLDRAEADAIYGQRLELITEGNRLQREAQRLRLNVETAFRNHLSAINGFETDIATLEANTALQERLLEQTTLRHEHGMASETDLREARHTLDQNALNLEMLRLSLENERTQLNRLINQPITANIRIIYDITDFEPLPEELESDRFIQRLAARDHTLLNWEDQVELRRHEWQRQLHLSEPEVRALRLEHQLATLERNLARRQAELNVRNAIAEWERLTEEEAALYAEVAQARDEYENMKNRLEAGMVTQIQVDMAAMGLAAQEARLARHGYAFWIARLRVEHPYVR